MKPFLLGALVALAYADEEPILTTQARVLVCDAVNWGGFLEIDQQGTGSPDAGTNYAPVVTNVVANNPSVDLASENGTVEITATLESGYYLGPDTWENPEVSIKIISPSTSSSKTFPAVFSSSVTPASAQYAAEFTALAVFDDYSEAGSWTVEVHAAYGENPEAMDNALSLSISNPASPDTTPPSCNSFALTAEFASLEGQTLTADVSNAEGPLCCTLTLTYDCDDDISGVESILVHGRFDDVEFGVHTHPEHPSHTHIFIDASSVPPGDYPIILETIDNAGNHREYTGSAELSGIGPSNIGVVNFYPQESNPPQCANLDLPVRVTVSGSAAEAEISVSCTDDTEVYEVWASVVGTSINQQMTADTEGASLYYTTLSLHDYHFSTEATSSWLVEIYARDKYGNSAVHYAGVQGEECTDGTLPPTTAGTDPRGNPSPASGLSPQWSVGIVLAAAYFRHHFL